MSRWRSSPTTAPPASTPDPAGAPGPAVSPEAREGDRGASPAFADPSGGRRRLEAHRDHPAVGGRAARRREPGRGRGGAPRRQPPHPLRPESATAPGRRGSSEDRGRGEVEAGLPRRRLPHPLRRLIRRRAGPAGERGVRERVAGRFAASGVPTNRSGAPHRLPPHALRRLTPPARRGRRVSPEAREGDRGASPAFADPSGGRHRLEAHRDHPAVGGRAARHRREPGRGRGGAPRRLPPHALRSESATAPGRRGSSDAGGRPGPRRGRGGPSAAATAPSASKADPPARRAGGRARSPGAGGRAVRRLRGPDESKWRCSPATAPTPFDA